MMNKLLSSFVILGIFICLLFDRQLKAQGLIWAKSTTGASQEQGVAMAQDASGNVFYTGTFTGSADFDPGPGVFTLTANSTYISDIFICKLSSAGNFIWAVKIGGSSTDASFAIDCDLNGDVYVTGVFQTTVDFNPGTGNFMLSSLGGPDVFLLKLDRNGNFIFAKKWGAGSVDSGNSVKVDGAGNIFVAGWFSYTVDFDPSSNNLSIASTGSSDIFISKFDAWGNLTGLYIAGGPDTDCANEIDIDNNGNLIVTGFFGSTCYFGSASLTSLGLKDAFVMKLDPLFNLQWLLPISGPSNDEGKSVECDNNGHIAITGNYINRIDVFAGTSTSFTSNAGSQDIYLGLLNASGVLLWANSYGSSGIDEGKVVTFDNYSNIFLGGYFNGSINLDPGFSNATYTSVGNADGFISKIDTLNDFKYAFTIGGSNIDQVWDCVPDQTGNLYACGWFSTTCDFDPSPLNYNLTAGGYFDSFVMKLAVPVIILSADLDYFNAEHHNGRILLEWMTLSELNNERFSIERSETGLNWESIGTVKGSGTSSTAVKYYFTDHEPVEGYNYYRLRQFDFDGTSQISKTRIVYAGKSKRTMIFPNPVRADQLTVFAADGIRKVSIFDIHGSLIRDVTLTDNPSGTSQIPIAEFTPGLYLVKYQSDESTGSEILIVTY